MADVQYVTLYIDGITPVQAIVGSPLYGMYLNLGATLAQTHTSIGVPVPGLDPTDPFPQYTTAAELAAAAAAAAGVAATFAAAYHADNANYPRPSINGVVLWIGTVNPLNRAAGDLVAISDPAPLPDVIIWSDAFTTDGALGTTEVGAKPWTVLGTGYTAARVGGKLKFTAGTSSIGLATVSTARSDGLLVATISTKGANNQAGIAFRVESLSNHLALVRTSSTDAHYRIVKRVANTYTTVAGTTVTMTDGDVIKVQMEGTTVTVTVNNVQAWTGTITEYATATSHGVYCGASTSFSEMAYDDMSFTGAA